MSGPSMMEIDALSGSLSATREVGALDALTRRAWTVAELAVEVNVDAVALDRMLAVLAANGVVDRVPDGFVASPGLRSELSGPGGSAGVSLWTALPNYLRTGAVVMPPTPAARAEGYRHAVAQLATMFAEPAEHFADRFVPLLPSTGVVLEVGAGAGTWSLPLLARNPGLSLVANDWPPVLETLMRHATALGVQDRVTLLPGDVHQVDLPVDVDGIIAANVLHLETPERAQAMVTRLGPALGPRGRFAIVGLMAEVDEAFERRRASYALHLGLRVRGAWPHDEPSMRAWLASAGLPFAARWSLGSTAMLGALVGTR